MRIEKFYITLETVFQTKEHAQESIEQSNNEHKEVIQIKYGIISKKEYRKFIDFYYWQYNSEKMKGLSLDELNISLHDTKEQAQEELNYIINN